MLTFWNRLINMSENRIPKIIFNFEYNSRFQNWTQEIKGIFRAMDQLNIYDCKCQCDLGSASQNLFLLNLEKWKTSMITKPKLRNYVMYKTEFKTENYVHSILSKSDRSLIAKLRCGI